MEILNALLSTFILFAISVVGWFLKEAFVLLRELRVERLRSETEQNLQIESYFREVSGKDLNEILKKWSTLIDDLNSNSMTDKQLTKHMKDLTTKTFMYSSTRTTKILGLMQQLTYENGKIEKKIKVRYGKEKKNETDHRTIVYTSFIIASLKEDFTGYEIDPLDFLRLRLTDFNDPDVNGKIKQAEKDILEKLKIEGIEWRKK